MSKERKLKEALRVLGDLGTCRTWGVDSEKRPQRGQFLPDLQAHSLTMGQKAGKKWTAEAVSQPTFPKSDRLLGMPRAQRNERTALCLLALVNVTPTKRWSDAEAPLIGITPIMGWAKENYDTEYAPNTREAFRRQSMHQFIEAGVCLYNPDKPERPVNSPKAVYQVEPHLLTVLKLVGAAGYKAALAEFQSKRQTLVAQYAKARDMQLVPVKVKAGYEITLSPGDHSELFGTS